MVSTTPELATADLRDQKEFARLLCCEIPEDWPAPLNDTDSKTYTLNYVLSNPEAAGWSTWYFLLPGKIGKNAEVIGIGGFTGKPSPQGVELGYSILPKYQRLGLASEAVGALTEWAFSHSCVEFVTAQTYPALFASIRVLEKNGFRLIGARPEDGTIRYGLGRESFLGAANINQK